MRPSFARVLLGMLFGVCALARGQSQLPSFRAGVTLVPVDVRVVARNGNPVDDLTKDDFIVLEDGLPQQIKYFERQVLQPRPPGASPGFSTAGPFVVRAQDRRVFYFELGRLWLANAPFGLV